MKRTLHTAVLLLIASSYGCQSNNAVIIDQLPDFIPKEQTHSTLMLTMGLDSSIRFGSSAIILSDTQLLTNRHVWVREDEWWNSEPLEEQQIGFFFTCTKCDKLHEHSEIFELVAIGEVKSELDSPEFQTDRLLSDWVLIETKKPFWDSLLGAPIYPPAIDPDWRAPDGTDLYVLGFSSIFRNEEKQTSFIQGGPYTIAAKAMNAGDFPVLQYDNDWPTPRGHSGGGVYIWNEKTKQLELVGVFHSESTASRTASVFNLIKISLGKTKVLYYTPIAIPLQAFLSEIN
ncbi:MAG: hypothetical protein H8E86_07415 [Planctomycetes bacterium]|nr:hypothetical protein [Planctomycetota bacterium]